MRKVFVYILIVFSTAAFAEDNIDYKHKAVIKTLIKTGQLVNPSLIEMKLPKPVEDAYHLNGKFFDVKSENNSSSIKTIYIGRVNSCRAGGCSIPNNELTGETEYFDYMVCFNANGEVALVKVFNYQATHGYEVTAKGWLKQFIGYSSDQNLEVGKNIDSISGATISVHGITKDVEEKTRILHQIQTN